MKKLIIVLLFLAVIAPVFAQNQTNNRSDNFYYINVSIEKVYPSKEGYLVQYTTGSAGMVFIGIPNEWFYDPAGNAQIVKLPMASDWPTMTVFYEDGKFSHLRLYVHPSKSHWTWGNIPQGADVSKYFLDKESFKLEF
jgi:hypothetical protein